MNGEKQAEQPKKLNFNVTDIDPTLRARVDEAAKRPMVEIKPGEEPESPDVQIAKAIAGAQVEKERMAQIQRKMLQGAYGNGVSSYQIGESEARDQEVMAAAHAQALDQERVNVRQDSVATESETPRTVLDEWIEQGAPADWNSAESAPARGDDRPRPVAPTEDELSNQMLADRMKQARVEGTDMDEASKPSALDQLRRRRVMEVFDGRTRGRKPR